MQAGDDITRLLSGSRRDDPDGRLAAGERVMGRYEILEELGTGGTGVVYRARDLERAADVALKTLQQLSADDIHTLKSEFRSLADLTHPNIVNLYDLVSDGGRWFFTMELVDGRPLTDHVWNSTRARSEQPGRCPAEVDQLRPALLQLAQAVQALHDAGKLHRDIKPPNVLVSGSGRVVLLDFGIMVKLGESDGRSDASATPAGTFGFMAPEQLRAERLTPAADWYAVGAVLYEALTGRPPRQQHSPSANTPLGFERLLEQAGADRDGPCPAPSELVDGVPEDLERLCRALMSPRPEDRPDGLSVIEALAGARPSVARAERGNGQENGAPIFVGRTTELATLESAFRDLERSRPAICFVHGPSGIGKSALAERFVGTLSTREHVLVLEGRCFEQESVPFKALDAVIDAVASHLLTLSDSSATELLPEDIASLAQVFPALRRVDAVRRADLRTVAILDQQEVRRRAFEGLRALLVRLGQHRRLVLLIDDLQWGDADSADLLLDLLRPPESPCLLFVGCYRTEDVARSACLVKLLADSHGTWPCEPREIVLPPLAPDDARELASRLLERAHSELTGEIDRIADESHGNPYFVEALTEDLAPQHGGQSKRLNSGPVELDDVIWRRVTQLPPEARRILEVVSVHEGPLPRSVAYTAASVDGPSATALNVLRNGRLLRPSAGHEDTRIETYHDRIRETVQSRLTPEVTRQHHRALASTFAASGATDPAVIAAHLEGAGDTVEAAHHYELAGDRAAEALAFNRAAARYRRCLDLGQADGTPATRRKLADALANAGRGAEAAPIYRALAAVACADERPSLMQAAAFQYCVSGCTDEGKAVFGELLPELGLRGPATTRTAVAWIMAHRIRSLFIRPPRGAPSPLDLARCDALWAAGWSIIHSETLPTIEFFARNLVLASKAGEPGRLAGALAFDAGARATAGQRHRVRARPQLERARDIAAAIGDPHADALVHLATGLTAYASGAWRESLTDFASAEVLLRERCAGVVWEIEVSQSFRIGSLLQMGHWTKLSQQVRLCLADAHERGSHLRASLHSVFGVPQARLAEGDPSGARRTVTWAIEGNARHASHLANATYSLAQIDLYEAVAQDGFRRIDAAWPALRKLGIHRHQAYRTALRYCRALSLIANATSSEPDGRSLREAERDARRIEREQLDWANPMVHCIRAGVAAVRGQRGKAQGLFGRAATGFESADMLGYAASALRRQGELMDGAAGSALVLEAERRLIQLGTVDPLRMARVYAPELPRRPEAH